MNRIVYQPTHNCGCRKAAVPQNVPPCKPESRPAPMPRDGEACCFAKEHSLAMAYVQMQSFGELYDPCTALIAGTLFPALDKPFCGETVSASAYPKPPARTCDCALPANCGRHISCSGREGELHD